MEIEVTEEIDTNTDTNNEKEVNTVNEDTSTSKEPSKEDTSEKQKLLQLPLNRVKAIMKMDPDCNIISKQAVFLTTKATELFVKALGRETLKYTQMAKRKTILKKDLDNAIDSISSLCFLEGTLEQLL